MTTLNSDVYDAFRCAGVKKDVARRAAASVVDHETELRRLEREVSDLQSTQRLHGWIVTALMGLAVAVASRAPFL